MESEEKLERKLKMNSEKAEISSESANYKVPDLNSHGREFCEI